MNPVRRALVLTGLTAASVIGAAIPASATFTDSGSLTTAVATDTVAPPASVTVSDYCLTTTTTVRRVTSTDPVTGVTTQTSYSATSSTVVSTSNVQSPATTTTTAGPGPTETTAVTVSKNTDLVVTASWTPSASRGVTGYLVSAHLALGGSVVQMDQKDAATTSTNARVDADYLYYQPSLSVTTLTSYGWTAQSAQTAQLTC
jgi:hypothetical protein